MIIIVVSAIYTLGTEILVILKKFAAFLVKFIMFFDKTDVTYTIQISRMHLRDMLEMSSYFWNILYFGYIGYIGFILDICAVWDISSLFLHYWEHG